MKIRGLFLAGILLSSTSFSQVKMDLELHGGALLKTNNLKVEDAVHSFELSPGTAVGLDFHLWLKHNLALTLSYTQATSNATLKQTVENSPILISMKNSLGQMKDRILTMGVTKRYYILPNTSISPNLSVYYNPYFFDSKDIDYSGSFLYEETGILESEWRNTYARLSEGYGKVYGAFGGSLGLRLSQEVPNIGTFSLRASYGFDLNRNIRQVVSNDYYNTLIDTQTSSTISTDVNNLEYINDKSGRNTFLLELGFKMPCSILMGRGK